MQLGDIEIAVTRKDVKHVHLSVHPPEGHVTLVAPAKSRLDVLRAYAITRSVSYTHLDVYKRQAPTSTKPR